MKAHIKFNSKGVSTLVAMDGSIFKKDDKGAIVYKWGDPIFLLDGEGEKMPEMKLSEDGRPKRSKLGDIIVEKDGDGNIVYQQKLDKHGKKRFKRLDPVYRDDLDLYDVDPSSTGLYKKESNGSVIPLTEAERSENFDAPEVKRSFKSPPVQQQLEQIWKILSSELTLKGEAKTMADLILKNLKDHPDD